MLWGTDTIRIATYNLKNLFLCGEGPDKPEKEIRPLLRMIEQVQADVLLVQEVGSLASLSALNERLAEPYPYPGLVEGNSDRSIHLGVLSRLPVHLASHRTLELTDEAGAALYGCTGMTAARTQIRNPLSFARDLLRVDVQGLSAPLSLFAVHLKSQFNQPGQILTANAVRRAECRMICQVMRTFQADHAQTLMVLAGDFNDGLLSDALAPLRTLGLQDPLGDVLKSDGRNPSTYWPKRRTRIDHILLSADTAVYMVPDSPRIHASQMARTASDHYPVSLALGLQAAAVG